jgi:hypothetical protein
MSAIRDISERKKAEQKFQLYSALQRAYEDLRHSQHAVTLMAIVVSKHCACNMQVAERRKARVNERLSQYVGPPLSFVPSNDREPRLSA